MLPLVTILLQDTRSSSDYHLTYPKPCAHFTRQCGTGNLQGRGGERRRRRKGKGRGGEGERGRRGEWRERIIETHLMSGSSPHAVACGKSFTEINIHLIRLAGLFPLSSLTCLCHTMDTQLPTSSLSLPHSCLNSSLLPSLLHLPLSYLLLLSLPPPSTFPSPPSSSFPSPPSSSFPSPPSSFPSSPSSIFPSPPFSSFPSPPSSFPSPTSYFPSPPSSTFHSPPFFPSPPSSTFPTPPSSSFPSPPSSFPSPHLRSV